VGPPACGPPARAREGMAIAKAKGELKAQRRSCPHPDRAAWSNGVPPESTPSPNWPNCSRSSGPLSNASSNALALRRY
jgi:hypothetical protein